jgi:hypothetical protein
MVPGPGWKAAGKRLESGHTMLSRRKGIMSAMLTRFPLLCSPSLDRALNRVCG